MEKIINIDTGKTLVTKLKKADTFRTRFWGLLPSKSLPEGEGLLLTPCRSIHTFFMRFKIDVLYLDQYYGIVRVYREVSPWRILPSCKKTNHVLELPAGMISATETCKGHRIAFFR
jgi:uncharacterized membrane protein (UPF0127 family)